MKVSLEISFANVDELSQVAAALKGIKGISFESSEEVVTPKATPAPTTTAEVFQVNVAPKATTPATEPTPAKEVKPKALTAAEKKALKKEQEEAEKAERIARLKAQMAQTEAATPATPTTPAVQTAPAVAQGEDPAAIAEEIKQLGDTLLAFQGMPHEQKQALTAQVMQQVGVPAGVRPSQLQQPMLGQFRDTYRAAVNSVVNPVMGGLV